MVVQGTLGCCEVFLPPPSLSPTLRAILVDFPEVDQGRRVTVILVLTTFGA